MLKEERLPPWLDLSLEDIEGEEWRDIFGYDGMYSISNFGRVKSERRYSSDGRNLLKERILRQPHSIKIDPCVVLYKDALKTTFRVLSLVGEQFLGSKEIGEVYCHKNKIKFDNRLENVIRINHSDSLKLDYFVGVKKESISKVTKNRYSKYKFFVDRKKFKTMEDLSEYISNQYKVEKDCVLKRLNSGATIEECKLSEIDYRILKSGTNKGGVIVEDTLTKETFTFFNSNDKKLRNMFSTSAITKALKTGEPTKITKLSKYKNPCIIKRTNC